MVPFSCFFIKLSAFSIRLSFNSDQMSLYFNCTPFRVFVQSLLSFLLLSNQSA